MGDELYLLVLYGLALLQAGCMLPVPLSENKVLAGKSISEYRLSFLQSKSATRQDVEERIGKPDILWEDERVYVYDWDMRQGVLLYAMGGGYSGAAGLQEIPRHHLLIIRFDEQDRVADFARTTRPMLQPYANFLREWLSKSSGKAEQKNTESEESAIVLLHIHCLIDGKLYNPFPAPSLLIPSSLFCFWIGSFETVGEPRYRKQQYLSDESRGEGWVYFKLSPGIHYLAINGPESDANFKDSGDYLQRAPRWRIDIPPDAKAVYVGTLQATGRITGELMFGEKIIRPASRDFQVNANDRLIAKDLVAQHFPAAGEPQTLVMRRWDPESPVVIRSSGAVLDTTTYK